jgi:hypothetical protein
METPRKLKLTDIQRKRGMTNGFDLAHLPSKTRGKRNA